MGAPVDAALAYDEYAHRYDDLLTENHINAYMRQEMTRTLLSTFGPGNQLIELGSGTGDEAISLARAGCNVVAVDPSQQMVQLATRKAAAEGLGNRLEFLVASAVDAAHLLGERGTSPRFDGAYASFSLSYEPNLSKVAEALAPLIVKNGLFVIAHMNRLCGVELMAAVLWGRPSLAGRRIGIRTLHKVGERVTLIFPRTASEILRAFRPYFALDRLRALPAVLPPHYANRSLGKLPGLLELLLEADSGISRLPLIRGMGDQNLLCLRRIG
ncbi:MAG TPA: class I SAM-dependent methyltransferase [Thermoplasmata archaeon]|nr:class I SAM-dependent methyltransferase [Thermoplasmata archaeon]